MKITAMPTNGGRYATWEETSQIAQIYALHSIKMVSPKDAKMIHAVIRDFCDRLKSATEPSEGGDTALSKVLNKLSKCPRKSIK